MFAPKPAILVPKLTPVATTGINIPLMPHGGTALVGWLRRWLGSRLENTLSVSIVVGF